MLLSYLVLYNNTYNGCRVDLQYWPAASLQVNQVNPGHGNSFIIITIIILLSPRINSLVKKSSFVLNLHIER